jgi:glutaredoxin-like protein
MFENIEGKRVPDVTFKTRRDFEWVDLTSDDVFAGKSVVVFSLPGAFTPTCSSSHVPRYNQLAPKFTELGIDEIICISVNDAFVMAEWQHSQNADRVTFLPDGNGDFTEMLVRDGVVEKMFIEPEEPGDPFKVSDADTMLKYLDPEVRMPHDVTIFSRPGCPFCAKAKGLLRDAGIEFEELVLNRDYSDRTLRAVVVATSYPQIFIDGQHIGGSDDLEAWLDETAAEEHRPAA